MKPQKPQNPRRPRRSYDTFHMGRSCMDLYSNDVGADFVHIKSFAAYVGGSPTNMSVGCCRLGLKSALLTAFGEDPVGDFVVHFLTKEGMEPPEGRQAGKRLRRDGGDPPRLLHLHALLGRGDGLCRRAGRVAMRGQVTSSVFIRKGDLNE